jgi:hypothetical protein
VNTALIVTSVKYGAGRHVGDVEPSHYTVARELNLSFQLFSLVTLTLVKLSVGLSLYRITFQNIYKWVIVITMGKRSADLCSG